jgi:chaperone BCS1
MNIDLNIISTLIQAANTYLETVLNGNDFAIGVVWGGLSGVGMYIAKDIPFTVYHFLIKHLTTKLEVNNTQESFHLLMRYLMRQGLSDNSRTLRLSNGRHGENKNTTKEIGYGRQLFIVRGRPVSIHIEKEEGGQSKIVKEFITIRKLGRSHKMFDELLDDIQHNRDASKLRYYRWDWDDRILVTEQPRFDLSQVILSEDNRRDVLETVDKFIANEQWYLQHNIPYQLGILLYGPPGTGKGVLTKALAGYLSRDILMVDDVADLTKAAESAPSDCIIMADEIDTMGLSKRDEDDSGEKDKKTFGMGKILTALDGGIVNHGRIIVMTTNFHETLDDALLRPGRVDLKLELGHLTTEMFSDMIEKFYPDNVMTEGYNIQDGISPAYVQNLIMLGKTPDEIMKVCGDKYIDE